MAQNATMQKASSEDGFSITGLALATEGINTHTPIKRASSRFSLDGDERKHSEATLNMTGKMLGSHAVIVHSMKAKLRKLTVSRSRSAQVLLGKPLASANASRHPRVAFCMQRWAKVGLAGECRGDRKSVV